MPFFLSPLDNTVPTSYAPLLLFFPLPASETERAIACLLRGLRALFDRMPLLGGSIKAVPDRSSPQTGTLAVTGPWRTVDAIFRVTDSRSVRKYKYYDLRAHGFPPSALPMWDFVNMGHYFESDPPVMHVQITLIDGGLVLAPCIHHCIADGTGSATILRYWAAACRGESFEDKVMTELWERPRPAKLKGDIALGEFPQYSYSKKTDILKTRSQVTVPKEKRWLMKIAWIHDVSNKIGAFCKPIAIRLLIQAIFTTQSLTHSTRLLYFPYSELLKLKEDTTRTFTARDNKPWISTMDILSALIFCCTTQARLRSKRIQTRWLTSILPSSQSPPPPQPTPSSPSARLMAAINARKHHQPHLSPSYIGNMILLARIDTPAQSLHPSTETVAAQALRLRESILQIDTTYLTRTIAALRSVPDISKVNYSGGADEDYCLVLSSWREQDICALDWGVDVRVRCERVRVYDFYIDGLGFVFPEYEGAREGGGLEVVLMLKKGAMRELERDEFFGRFVRWRDGGDGAGGLMRGVLGWAVLPVIGLGLIYYWGFVA